MALGSVPHPVGNNRLGGALGGREKSPVRCTALVLDRVLAKRGDDEVAVLPFLQEDALDD